MTAGQDPQPTGQKSPGCRRLVLTVLILVFGLALIEALLWLFAPPPTLLRLDQLGDHLTGAKQQMTKIIDYDPEVFWRFKPNIEVPRGEGPLFGRISNGQRLREPGDVATPKQKDEVRILFLGDSCTFGYLLEQHETYVRLTEERLRRQFPGKRIRCLNGGVPGYSMFQCWRLLESQGLALEPDLVIVQAGWNGSIVWDQRSDAEHYRAHQRCTPPGFLQHSRLCRLLWINLFWPGPGEDGRARVAPSEMRKLCERIEASAKTVGADTLVLLTGSRTNLRVDALSPLQAAQMEFASTRQFATTRTPPFIDGITPLRKLVRERGVNVDRLLFDDAHPTRAFNESLADAITKKLVPWLAAK